MLLIFFFFAKHQENKQKTIACALHMHHSSMFRLSRRTTAVENCVLKTTETRFCSHCNFYLRLPVLMQMNSPDESVSAQTHKYTRAHTHTQNTLTTERPVELKPFAHVHNLFSIYYSISSVSICDECGNERKSKKMANQRIFRRINGFFY